MFVFISMLISIGILWFMFYLSKQRESTLQRKYELLINLRQLLLLSRQHRSITHHALISNSRRDTELNEIQDQLFQKSNQLIATAHFDNKPMYRVLQLKLKALMNEWSERSVARNQMMHGKTIRHCMFLMDEVILAWLVESSREDLSDEYHINWQQVIDAMDALTQLRICIDDMQSQDGRMRLQHYSDVVRRKMNQLALISPLTIASPSCSSALHSLGELHDHPAFDISPDKMYQITTEISLSIAHVYDQMLSDLTESLYQPLPKIAFS
ncbi:hypothetical protein [Vibrio aestuarianus]|uniref:Nitrate/nitrite sensing protein domain-containing protein n=1 Tax=Vibrio aestuarianus TaxID=28171 RepID=A0A9X4IQH0_9VIBR|nr:hypothetical protein [Vibrio aestuarianus]MDE1243042.1 hypothetical protein [Vibrio aestuarianus]